MSGLTVYALTFLIYLLNTYLLFWYGYRLFDYRKNFKTTVTICLAANIILWLLLNLFFNEVVNIVATIILFGLVLYSAFRCDKKLALFHSLLLVALMWIAEYMIIFIVSYILDLEVTHFKNDIVIMIEEAFASKFLYFILLTIISSFAKKRMKKDGTKISIYLTILPATTFFITVVLRVQSQYFESSVLSTSLCVVAEVLMFIANIVVFSVHERDITNQKKLHDMEMVEQKQATNLEYLDILEKKDEETRIFIHDIRNNLINISNLTTEENVKQYIQDIYDKSNEVSIKAKTKNRVLDVIINKYALLCKDKNIRFTTVAPNENLSFISDYDLSAILDNILRNAVERAENETEPYIELTLDCDNKFHKIILKNSCSSEPIADNDTLITTKENKKFHGYGMRSVAKALKNYNGEFEWMFENNEFKIVILIPVKTSNLS
ncbi:MAG: GHKL domain-containing protein [Clostridia bacterium]|nr:GHKL domain-containing protein [Clostridia bacterium]